MSQVNFYWKFCKDFFVVVSRVLVSIFWSCITTIFQGLMKKKCVKNKVVLITGAASGLGRQMSIDFAQLGAILVLWDKNSAGLKETVSIIKTKFKYYQRLEVYEYACDIRDRLKVYEIGEMVKKEVGNVDILINNAAVAYGQSILETSDENILETFDVNLLSHFWTVKCFLPSMLERNEGHIVSIASSCGFAGVNKLLPYSASKFGVIGFSEVLSYENEFSGHDGVKVTMVCPSFVKTPLFYGCRMKYPSLVPDLEIKPTVERIMDGIRREEEYVFIPRSIAFLPILKSLLPYKGWLAIHRFFEADKFMDSFKGHKEEVS